MDAQTNARLAGLLAQTAMRNQSAFTALYRTTSPKLFGVALRILRRHDWTEEVLQDCYADIWLHARNYPADRVAPLIWLTSLVRNRCLNRLRRARAETSGNDFDVTVEQWANDAPAIIEQLVATEDAAALARCLGTLSERQQQSIMLTFFHGLTHAELAAHLHELPGSAKKWLRHGLRTLKNCLVATNPS